MPEALAQHEQLEETPQAYGRQAIRVHAIIIGSAGIISKSLHIILTIEYRSKSETKQRLLNSIEYNNIVRLLALCDCVAITLYLQTSKLHKM